MSLSYAIDRVVRLHGGHSHGNRPGIGTRHSIPAPVKGWNTRDALQSMKPQYGIRLDNFFPELGRVRMRRGYRQHATAVGTAAVETLTSHVSGTVSKLIAAGGGAIYDATLAAPTSLASGFSSNRWQTCMFTGRTFFVNGTDDPQRLEADGATIAAAAWTGTGLTATDLIQVTPFKNRLMFVEKDSGNIWYGGVSEIQGELSKIAIDRVHPQGGNVAAIGTITRDAGQGVDDMLVILMSDGSTLLYSGTDPSNPNAFGLVGIWRLGRAVGNRPLVKFGGDLVAITTDGYLPLQQVFNSALGRDADRYALSATIESAVSEVVRTYGDQFGWQAVLHTDANWLLFNVPSGRGSGTVQHVMNTQTGAWCRFTGLAAHCWAEHGGKMYFGSDAGVINIADAGSQDGSIAIEADAQSAYNYFRTPMDKRFTMLRALVDSDADIGFALGASVDFEPDRPLETTTSVSTGGAKWNSVKWNTSPWSGGVTQQNTWQVINKEGTAMSVRIRVSSRGARLAWYAADVIHEKTVDLL